MGTSSLRYVKLGWVFAISVCLLLSWQARNTLTGAAMGADANQNLTMAYNLYVNGILSLATQPPFVATDLREPLPPMVTALFLALYPDINHAVPLASFFQGEHARLIKQVNVPWIFLGLLGTWVLTHILCCSHRGALLAVLSAYLFFFGVSQFTDTLYTEIPAAVIILWTAVALVSLTRCRGLLAPILSGLLFGMLALTKAVFLYICVPIILLLILYYTLGRRQMNAPPQWAAITALMVAFVMVVSFWMVRNKVALDRFEISGRGGDVLLVRALKNEMSRHEVVGAWWYWGPSLYRKLVSGTALNANDADFAAGGKFQRLNRYASAVGDRAAMAAGKPEDAVSFYFQSWAWHRRFSQQPTVPRSQDTTAAADVLLKRKALEMIFRAPGTHLAMTPLFLWRGIWCFPDVGLPYLAPGYRLYLINALDAIAYLSLFSVFAIGLARRRYDLVAMTVVPVAMLAFYAVFSHNIPRYSAPMIPIMLVSILVILSGKLGAGPRDPGDLQRV